MTDTEPRYTLNEAAQLLAEQQIPTLVTRRTFNIAGVTGDGLCVECGAVVGDVDGEVGDEGNIGVLRVVMSIWYTLKPCGHTAMQATGANVA